MEFVNRSTFKCTDEEREVLKTFYQIVQKNCDDYEGCIECPFKRICHDDDIHEYLGYYCIPAIIEEIYCCLDRNFFKKER